MLEDKMVGEYKFYCTKDLLTPPKKKKRKKGLWMSYRCERLKIDTVAGARDEKLNMAACRRRRSVAVVPSISQVKT